MTAREHYQVAERLLDAAAERRDGHRHYPGANPITIAAAQVHATLALAAATAPELASTGGKASG